MTTRSRPVQAARRLIVVALASAAFGCETSDQDQVASVFKERIAAAIDRDAERLCELTSPEYREAMTSPASTEVDECTRQTDRHWGERSVTTAQREASARARVVDVQVRGDEATASLERDGCTSWESEFRKDDGEWRYDGPLSTQRTPRCARSGTS